MHVPVRVLRRPTRGAILGALLPMVGMDSLDMTQDGIKMDFQHLEQEEKI